MNSIRRKCIPPRIEPSYRNVLMLVLILLPALAGCSLSGSSSSSGNSAGQSIEAPSDLEPTEQPTPFSLYEPTPTPPPSPTPGSTSAARPTPDVVQTELVSTIDALLAGEPGVFGVVILNERGDYQYARNADVPFVAASLYKLVLLAEIFAQIEASVISMDDPLTLDPGLFDDQFAAEDGYYALEDAGGQTTVEQALFGAGAYSSNIAAKTLMSLTSEADLKLRAESLGMYDTYFNVNPADLPAWPDRYTSSGSEDALLGVAFIETQAMYNLVNITTPNDIARFWLQLLRGEVVSPESSQAIIEILREQVVDDRIPLLLPEGIATANKTGNLYHVVHDTGLVFDPHGTLIVAVLSEGEPDDDHGREVIQRIALAATGENEIPPYTTPESSPETE